MRERIQQAAMAVVDALIAAWPAPLPDAGKLRLARIIAHRGQFDNRRVMENTLSAFDLASENGVWGIECDIRWSADLVPVIHHDADTARVFGRNLVLRDTPFAQLREQLPQIPTLAEVVERFGGNTHLMLELKSERFDPLLPERGILEEHLAGLSPGRDYHILALDPALFALVAFLPPSSCLPVAETNIARLSEIALEHGYSGLLGHYLLLGRTIQRRHQRAGQCIGTGFTGSRRGLYREVNRGVEWIFSNNAVKLQRLIDTNS